MGSRENNVDDRRSKNELAVVAVPSAIHSFEEDRNRTSIGNPGNLIEMIHSGATYGALGAQNGPADPELAAVVDARPRLPAAITPGILAMVRAAK